MSKQDLKKCCGDMFCLDCPLDKTKYLCRAAGAENYIPLIVILNEIKNEIEKLEKEIK